MHFIIDDTALRVRHYYRHVRAHAQQRQARHSVRTKCRRYTFMMLLMTDAATLTPRRARARAPMITFDDITPRHAVTTPSAHTDEIINASAGNSCAAYRPMRCASGAYAVQRTSQYRFISITFRRI